MNSWGNGNLASDQLPPCSLVVAVDKTHLEELKWTWPTWMKFRPQFLDWPLIVAVDGDVDLRVWQESLAFINHPRMRIVPWCRSDVCQREKMISSLVHVPAQEVSTPWYLKLDTDAVATAPSDWPLAEWFAPDRQGNAPVFVTSPWGYTKPAHLIDTLQNWGDQESTLGGFPRIPLSPEPGANLISHKRIISWCFFANTVWTKKMAALVPERLPVASQDTFLWYCAARRRDFYRTVRMSHYGWSHVRGIRRIRRLSKVAMEKSLVQPHEHVAPVGPETALRANNSSNEGAQHSTRSSSEELVRILKSQAVRVVRGAEIGVLSGTTSSELLTAFPELFIYMVDTWSVPHPHSSYVKSGDSAARQHWTQQLANEQIAYERTMFASGRRVLLRAESHVAGRAVTDESLDFAFIDADHSLESVRLDIQTWWPKVRSGGLLCGHDYNSRRDRRGIWGVRKAVTEFSTKENRDVHLGRHHIWWIQKA